MYVWIDMFIGCMRVCKMYVVKSISHILGFLNFFLLEYSWLIVLFLSGIQQNGSVLYIDVYIYIYMYVCTYTHINSLSNYFPT